MLYVDAINKDDTYNLYDVFGGEKIFYPKSIIRIHGWETPASLVYVQDKKIKIRFKRVLEPFYKAYQDQPFEGDPDFIFYDKVLEDYTENEGYRRMEYAIQEYKKLGNEFSAKPLFPKQIEEKLNDDELFFERVFSFDHRHGSCAFFSIYCFFFPVDVDAIVTDVTNGKSLQKDDEAKLIYWNGETISGYVGYDKKFYCTERYLYGTPRVYNLYNGIEEIAIPEWLRNRKDYLESYKFLKNYIIAPDDNCYDYNGEYLEAKTKHHKNIGLLNTIIRLLSKEYPKEMPDTLHLQLVVPREFAEFDISLVEQLVVPHLKTKGLLNIKALEHFQKVRLIIEKVDLSLDFGNAFRNIRTLNRYTLYGGSRRNICGERLYDNLRKLNKKVGNERMAFLLNNEIELKTELAKMNNVKVEELLVSEGAFETVKRYREVPKELKTNSKWKHLEAGTMVVFSDGIEQFCTITTNTTKGLGINRI